MKPHWIVQYNMTAGSRDEVEEACLADGASFTTTKVVPFLGIIEREHEVEAVAKTGRPILAYGSTTMMRVVEEKGWKPGVFTEGMDFREWQKAFGPVLLNGDGTVHAFKDVVLRQPQFIRPCLDTKSFDGKVLGPDEFREWQRRVLDLNEDGYGYKHDSKLPHHLGPDTLVVVSDVKYISHEYRFFVVKRQVISGCQYKAAGHLFLQKSLPESLQDFVIGAIALAPCDTFVMDIARLPDGTYRVIELNSISGSGFYCNDVNAIVRAMNVAYANDL